MWLFVGLEVNLGVEKIIKKHIGEEKKHLDRMRRRSGKCVVYGSLTHATT